MSAAGRTGVLGNSFRLAMTIVGTTIGAGFASGREIWEFFTVYGAGSGQGILLFAGLYALCCWVILRISWQTKPASYSELLFRLMSPQMARVYDGLIMFYLFSLSAVMFAASGAVFADVRLPFHLGVMAIAVLVFSVLIFQIRGLLSLNSWLIPLLVLMLAAIAFFYLMGGEPGDSQGREQMEQLEQRFEARFQPYYGVWASSVVYTSFNLVPMIGVLCMAARESRHPRELAIGSLLSGLFLGGLAWLLNGALLNMPVDVAAEREILLFELAGYFPFRVEKLVFLSLWLAIYTTALSSIFSLATRLKVIVFWPHSLILAMLVIVIIPFSYFGFATLVKILYPIFGMASLFFVGCLLLSWIRGDDSLPNHHGFSGR
jgi:uncharacterized membrane protein YkvI